MAHSVLKSKIQETNRTKDTLSMSEVDPNPATMDPQSNEPQPIVPAPPRHRIFIGPNSLRAGWCLAIYCLIVAACLTGLHFAADAIHAYLRHGQTPVPAASRMHSSKMTSCKMRGPGTRNQIFAAWVEIPAGCRSSSRESAGASRLFHC